MIQGSSQKIKGGKKFVFPSFISIRRGIQTLFFSITVILGVQFYLFVAQLGSGAVPTLERPPGVEAFLPISALVSLKYFLTTGIFNMVHPSGLVLFSIICATAFLIKKGFCSWVCPIGLVSECLARLQAYLFPRPLRLTGWVDLPLRGIKYVLAGFFVWTIFFAMPTASVGRFIHSPYNTFADIEMLKFFTHISLMPFGVIVALLILSLLINHFWCRYLCPYGAVLGVISLLSTGRIDRDEQHCIHCGRCETVCPGQISIMDKVQINSLECSACLSCVAVCPQKNAIGFTFFSGKIPMNQKRIAVVIVALFTLGIATAKGTGHWQNAVPIQAYQQHVPGTRMPGTVPSHMGPGKMDPKKIEKMIRRMQSHARTLNKEPGI